MIGFLRFIGVMNAAVWFGTAFFVAAGVIPACFSNDMKDVLGPANAQVFPFFSHATAQVIVVRYFYVSLVCGGIAFLHLLMEWWYMGRPPGRKFALGLVTFLAALMLLGGFVVQPQLKQLHVARYHRETPPEQRQSAARSFRILYVVSRITDVLMIGGLGLYLWRVANPSDTLRFVSPTQFRG